MTKRRTAILYVINEYKDHFSYDLCNQFIFTNEWLVRNNERARIMMRIKARVSLCVCLRESEMERCVLFLGIEFICCYLFT